MVKDGQARADKYAAKNDATVISSRATAGKTLTDAAASVHQIAMGSLADFIRGILNTAGIPLINSVRFLGYANKLYGLSLKASGATGVLECTAVSKAWVAKITATAPEKVVLGQIWNHFSANFGTVPSPFPA